MIFVRKNFSGKLMLKVIAVTETLFLKEPVHVKSVFGIGGVR